VTTDLNWRLEEQIDEAFHVGLRLIDDRGQVWAQRDAPPGGGLARGKGFAQWPVDEPRLDRHGLLVPAGTPPGDYAVTVRVYRSDDVSVLPAVFEGGSGGEVTLGSVHISRPLVPPPVEALEIEQPLQVDFGDKLRLLGFSEQSAEALLPGEAVQVALYWQALTAPGEDLLPRLQLVDKEGAVKAELSKKPVSGSYPTAWWQAGEVVRDPHALPIPAAAPPGRYDLALSLVQAASGEPIETQRGQRTIVLSEIEVQGREYRYEPTGPEWVQTAAFGPAVELTGYGLHDAPYAPGSPIEVTLHWHARQTPEGNYAAFVHLLDSAGNIVAQHDALPGPEGAPLPTLGWLPGEYVTSTHHLHLPLDLPAGEYRLGVGLYDPSTGIRPGERVLLDTPILVGAGTEDPKDSAYCSAVTACPCPRIGRKVQ
jgi:hypothetical protein